MVRIDPEIKQKIRTNIATQIREQTKDMDKNDVVNLLIDTVFESQGRKELNNYLQNALFAAKTENIQLRLFDLDTLEPTDLEKDTIEFLNEKREACEITEEQYLDILAKIQNHRKKRVTN